MTAPDDGQPTLAHHVIAAALTMLTGEVASRSGSADEAISEISPQVAAWIHPDALPEMVARLLLLLDGVQIRFRAQRELLEARIAVLDGESAAARRELGLVRARLEAVVADLGGVHAHAACGVSSACPGCIAVALAAVVDGGPVVGG